MTGELYYGWGAEPFADQLKDSGLSAKDNAHFQKDHDKHRLRLSMRGLLTDSLSQRIRDKLTNRKLFLAYRKVMEISDGECKNANSGGTPAGDAQHDSHRASDERTTVTGWLAIRLTDEDYCKTHAGAIALKESLE